MTPAAPRGAAALAAALLAWSPVAAAAQTSCPSGPADLETGLSVGFGGGYSLVLVRTADGSLLEHERYSDGTGYALRSRDGIVGYESYQTRDGQVVPDTTERWDYPLDHRPLPRLEAGAGFMVQRMAVMDDGSRVRETMQVRADRARPTTLGGCPLMAIRVSVLVRSAGSTYYDVYRYLPQMGVGLFLGGAARPADIDLARPVTIAVASPGPIPGQSGAPSDPTPAPAPDADK